MGSPLASMNILYKRESEDRREKTNQIERIYNEHSEAEISNL